MAASLLTRLQRNADPQGGGRAVYRGDDLESAVLAHLERMLNTRLGSSLSAPDYGVTELSQLRHDFPDAYSIMQRSLKNGLLKYEPRLRNVQVKVVNSDDVGDALYVYFEISAQLLHPNGERQQISFSTSIDESSNVQIG